MSTTVIATIFVFGLLIFVHELGHFMTAKMVGMRVDEFAIGFGPKIFSRRYGETVYSLRIIPLGGFNKIAGMDPDEEQDERSFSAKPVWARISYKINLLLLPDFCLVIISKPLMEHLLRLGSSL
ncbi:MAG: metalloprotease RseP [Anaerospora sp.]|nr:metalloprotease RseP [Anaerospora sp.]